MRRKLLRVHLALKPDRFYLKELPVSEGEMLIFFPAFGAVELYFPHPLGVRKKGLKIAGDPDTLRKKKSFLLSCCRLPASC